MSPKTASLLLLLTGLVFDASAAVITFTDRAAFESAAGGALTLEGFNDPTLGSSLIGDFNDASLAAGLGISTGGDYRTATRLGCPTSDEICLGLIQAASVTFRFSPGVRAVGFDYNELSEASLAYVDSAGHAIDAALVLNGRWPTPYVPRFFGVISDVDLTWITVGTGTHSGGTLYFVDNLLFSGAASVPAPGTFALAGLGLAALAWRRCGYRA